MNLLEAENIEILQQSYSILEQEFKNLGKSLPDNSKAFKSDKDFLLRKLDCAVVQKTHAIMEKEKMLAFDSVRGMFIEGTPIYTNAGFNEKNHIQVCVRNLKNIIGFFIP